MPSLVLDTNVARDLCAGNLDDSCLRRARARGLTLHLSDMATLEFGHALATGRVAWDDWCRGRQILEQLLDRERPILLGGGSGLVSQGVARRHSPNPLNVSSAEVELLQAWRLLLSASSPNILDADAIGAAIAEERERWIEEFAELLARVEAARTDDSNDEPERGDKAEDIADAFRILAAGLDRDSRSNDAPPSVRLDAFLRVRALLICRHLRNVEPYNPDKNSNDAFDVALLRYLAYPAGLCTGDGRFLRLAEASGSWQRRWMVRPRELLQEQFIEPICTLTWPDAA